MQHETLNISSRARFRTVGSEGVVVQVERGEVMVVNGVGLRVLELVKESGSRNAIIQQLSSEYETGSANVTQQVDDYIEELYAWGILEQPETVPGE
ncbi:PqqD family protein [Solemya elarraichensis gill symbiont]|uniref:Pyrroloquinoline quinone biosynthesis protein PqqD n=1 Tax=Solemya elarraichensis gill symbiont TaxID=1918949 RepID=A0A1T2L1D6_9GAMM|nr:PqqD family protein [Solemya elarraichensis gill symbiont]OOZ38884.1 hypothetical protein BOW52_07945 [Solemya elarraichensis gill symbiont]